MKLVDRTLALLQAVEQYRTERCNALDDPARTEARSIVRSALADARRRVTTAIAEERRRRKREVGAVEASLATDRRLVAQQRAVRQLGRAWSALHGTLEARWREPGTRSAWVDAYVARALECLDRTVAWHVRHHPAWTDAERAAVAARLREQRVDVRFEHDPSLAAGFVIASGHNVLDASLDGLLADRAGIEGRLLQRMEESGA